MANFHFTVDIVGRSKGKSAVSKSAYLNGDVMKNTETGRYSDFTSKKEVMYRQLMMCENAPPEWEQIPQENIDRFIHSVRYSRAEDKEEALERFKLIWRKQKLWNEVLKVENKSDSQLARIIEFSLPREWCREEQIRYASEYIRKTFVDQGMCADWAIHDKGDGNPHVHLLLTMRPFKKDHKWGLKETKDWDFVRDDKGEIVIDPSHPDWWQDKKDPSRHGIRIPVLNADGTQKKDSRNRKQWKRVRVDATGWNSPENCELWRKQWAEICNEHLDPEHQVDHRSCARQGRMQIPQIHEGAEARKIEKKYQDGMSNVRSWKVTENEKIKQQNQILKKIQMTFGKVTGSLKKWKERLDDIRREYGSHSHDGRDDLDDRGTADSDPGNISANARTERIDLWIAGTKSKLERISREFEQRKPAFTETERRVAEIHRVRAEAEEQKRRREQIVKQMIRRGQSLGRQSVLEKLARKQAELKMKEKTNSFYQRNKKSNLSL